MRILLSILQPRVFGTSGEVAMAVPVGPLKWKAHRNKRVRADKESIIGSLHRRKPGIF
jgi:hypothetical protein